jgi:hypothetical protein
VRTHIMPWAASWKHCAYEASFVMDECLRMRKKAPFFFPICIYIPHLYIPTHTHTHPIYLLLWAISSPPPSLISFVFGRSNHLGGYFGSSARLWGVQAYGAQAIKVIHPLFFFFFFFSLR